MPKRTTDELKKAILETRDFDGDDAGLDLLEAAKGRIEGVFGPTPLKAKERPAAMDDYEKGGKNERPQRGPRGRVPD